VNAYVEKKKIQKNTKKYKKIHVFFYTLSSYLNHTCIVRKSEMHRLKMEKSKKKYKKNPFFFCKKVYKNINLILSVLKLIKVFFLINPLIKNLKRKKI
jgi:hypothetical protein